MTESEQTAEDLKLFVTGIAIASFPSWVKIPAEDQITIAALWGLTPEALLRAQTSFMEMLKAMNGASLAVSHAQWQAANSGKH
jgi:hypothetical protein